MVRQVRGKVKEEPGYRDWREIYEGRLTTAEEAVKAVKSGDTVVIPIFPPRMLLPALFARKDELRDVMVRVMAPATDPGWFTPGAEESFSIEFEMFIGDFARVVTDERRGAYLPNLFSLAFKPLDEGRSEQRPLDVAVVSVTPPNVHGYCGFGAHLWTKRGLVRRAATVVAEVDPTLITTFGDCFIHVSEIDHFVEYVPPTVTIELVREQLEGLEPERRAQYEEIVVQVDLQRLAPLLPLLKVVEPQALKRFLGILEPPAIYRDIGGYLNELVRDGDTIQIGVGEPSAYMTRVGAFEDKHDLGIHTEMGSPGLAKLVERGIASGRRKTIHKRKAVAIAWTGCDDEDLKVIDGNPAFELYDPEYLLDIRTISANDNLVAINNAVSVDLVGQINSESTFGGRMINGSGGQPESHIGALLSRGGRAVTLLPSTALEGAVSRIVPQLETGSMVTIPRFFADTIITEHGVARLWGKNHRQRAEELIAIAHPDFRAELRREAQRLWWP
jgi:4-hydroxybutyrate CoA-transferase